MFLKSLNGENYFIHSKIFNLTKYREVLVKDIFTAHCACKKSGLNLILVARTTNGFIFQTINS